MTNEIVIDYGRDSLFDELGIKRLKESYMREDETSHTGRFAYVSKAFGSIQNTRKDYMSIAVSIGYLTLLPFFLLVVLLVAFLYHASCLICTIAQKVSSIVCQK